MRGHRRFHLRDHMHRMHRTTRQTHTFDRARWCVRVAARSERMRKTSCECSTARGVCHASPVLANATISASLSGGRGPSAQASSLILSRSLSVSPSVRCRPSRQLCPLRSLPLSLCVSARPITAPPTNIPGCAAIGAASLRIGHPPHATVAASRRRTTTSTSTLLGPGARAGGFRRHGPAASGPAAFGTLTWSCRSPGTGPSTSRSPRPTCSCGQRTPRSGPCRPFRPGSRSSTRCQRPARRPRRRGAWRASR